MTLHRLESGRLTAAIDSFGAQLRSLQLDGTEYLWSAADPWNYSAPVLFPIISGLPGDELVHNGERYPIPSHGFARRMEWSVTGAARFELASSAQTLAAYPFAFRIVIEFSLDRVLTVRHAITNEGDEPMPFLLGAHPAFRWPLPGASGPHDVRWVSGGETMRQAVGGLRPNRIPSPAVDGRLVLDRAQFAEDAMLFDDIEPRVVTYSAPGSSRVVFHYADFSRLGIWSKPERGDFVCLEPWSGYPAPQGFHGDIIDLPEATVLPVGMSREFSYSIAIEGA
jgi:galactose mutarotase-like enzyme